MADPREHVGHLLGNYRLLRLLGRGAFAEVYLGEHIHLGTQAAIKVLYAKVDNVDIEAFRSEARTIASLEHPSIVRVLDFGVEGNTPFLVMSYAPGGTLRMRYPRGTRLPLAAVVSYVQQISSALQYAHERRLVHRDIKPENLLVGRNNEVLLSDFGIALVAQSSRYQHPQDVAGTISYMAPEQIQSYPRTASDQYSLGIVVYEWLGGEVPFKGTFTDVAVKHALMPPPRLREKIPTLSPLVEQVVFTALAKEPQQRFPTVQAFANALKQAYEVTQQPPQSFPMSGSTLYQSWQSTFVKAPPSHSLQPTVLNTLPATSMPNPSTTIPDPPTLPITTRPNPSIPQATLIPNPPTSPITPRPNSTSPVYASTPPPEAFPPSINTGKRETPRSFIRSTRFRVVLIAVVCAVIIAGVASSFVRSANSPQKVLHPAKLVVDHSLVDFGKIEKGAKATLAVDLSNIGGQPLRCMADVGKVTWLQVQTRSAIIEPGKNELDNLTIDTAYLPLGASSAFLTISSSSGNVQVQVRVVVIHSGKKAAILDVSTSSLDFGTVGIATPITPQAVLVSNVGTMALSWKADVGTARWVVLDRHDGTIQSGGSPQTINLKVQAAGLAPGSYTDTVTINSNGGKQSVHVSMMVNPSPSPSPTGTPPSPTLTSTLPSPTPPASTPTYTPTPAPTNTPTPTPTRPGSLIWTAPTGGGINSSPTVAGGVVYVGSDDYKLYAFNASGGALLWTASTGGAIYSSPTVAGGVVYVGSVDDRLYAFNASSGAPLWAASTGNHIYSSPTVAGGVVYVGSDDNRLYAFNASSGALLWSTATAQAGFAIRSSPRVVGGVVYVGSEDGHLYAFNASSGAPLWAASTGPIEWSSPAVVNGVVYVGSYDHNLYAFNASSGAPLWTASTGDHIYSSPVVAGGVVYVGSNDHNLYAFNASSGAPLWTASTGNQIYSSPAVVGGVVYVGSRDGNLYAFNASSGITQWTASTGGEIVSSPAVVGGVVYVGSYDHNLYAFSAP